MQIQDDSFHAFKIRPKTLTRIDAKHCGRNRCNKKKRKRDAYPIPWRRIPFPIKHQKPSPRGADQKNERSEKKTFHRHVRKQKIPRHEEKCQRKTIRADADDPIEKMLETNQLHVTICCSPRGSASLGALPCTSFPCFLPKHRQPFRHARARSSSR